MKNCEKMWPEIAKDGVKQRMESGLDLFLPP